MPQSSIQGEDTHSPGFLGGTQGTSLCLVPRSERQVLHSGCQFSATGPTYPRVPTTTNHKYPAETGITPLTSYFHVSGSAAAGPPLPGRTCACPGWSCPSL